MSTATAVGVRTKLRAYTTGRDGDRVVYGQRVNGHVRVTDRPADSGSGRSFLITPRVESRAELDALLADYLQQAKRFDAIPMRISW